MRRPYPFHLIEPKWQRYWETQAVFCAWNPGDDIPDDHPFARRHGLGGPISPERLPPRFNIFDIFPGRLRVGCLEGYTAADILARYHRARGRHVLLPMDWDAFGLRPLAIFRRQIKALGFSCDWSGEIVGAEPSSREYPDDILLEFGADAFRLHEMFIGPLERVKPQRAQGVEGVYRFLGRVWRLFIDEQSETHFEQSQTASGHPGFDAMTVIKRNASIQNVPAATAQLKTLHACIKKVTEDLDSFRFNTAIAALMIFVNEAIAWEIKPVAVMEDFLKLLHPFAPHLAEELRSKISDAPTLACEPWPKFDSALLKEDTLEIPVQVNGWLRDRIVVAAGASQAEIEAAALASKKIRALVGNKTVKKVVLVPKRLMNIVV